MRFCNLCHDLIEDCTCVANLPEMADKIQQILRGKDGKDFEADQPGPFILDLQMKMRHAMINVENYSVFKGAMLDVAANILATLQKYEEKFQQERCGNN